MTPLLKEERELKQLGGSLIVSIPKAMAKSLNLAPKERVRIRLTEQVSIMGSKKEGS